MGMIGCYRPRKKSKSETPGIDIYLFLFTKMKNTKTCAIPK